MAPDRYDWLWQHTFEVDQQGALKGDYVQQDAGTKICARIIEQTIPVREYMAVSHTRLNQSAPAGAANLFCDPNKDIYTSGKWRSDVIHLIHALETRPRGPIEKRAARSGYSSCRWRNDARVESCN